MFRCSGNYGQGVRMSSVPVEYVKTVIYKLLSIVQKKLSSAL
jgi:hypothetical protein